MLESFTPTGRLALTLAALAALAVVVFLVIAQRAVRRHDPRDAELARDEERRRRALAKANAAHRGPRATGAPHNRHNRHVALRKVTRA